MSNRDEFSKATVDLLGKRAGHICAYPGCRQLTVGPSDNRKSGVMVVGVAAHITAAAEGGPRFDGNLTPDERSSEANGIWMCQTHGKLIDDTESQHDVVQLRRWKKQHEEWVFARIAASDSVLKHGLTKISLEKIGIFQNKVSLALGRHNVIFGPNFSGKSTLCEGIAALSGGIGFRHLCDRFGLFQDPQSRASIEASVSITGARTTVRIGEEASSLKRPPAKHQSRLHVEVDGNMAPSWPQSIFNVVYLGMGKTRRNTIKNRLRLDLLDIGSQIGLDEGQIWDALREEFFCSSVFGTRMRRSGEYSAEVFIPKNNCFFDYRSLAASECTFALIDVALRLMRADPRPTPWILIVDWERFLMLDRSNKRRLVKGLSQIDDFELQTIVCVNSEQDALGLTVDDDSRWIGSSSIGGIVAHAFL